MCPDHKCALEVNFLLIPTHRAWVHIAECFRSAQTGFPSDKTQLQDAFEEHIQHVPAAKGCSVHGAGSGEPLQHAQCGDKFSALTLFFSLCAYSCCPALLLYRQSSESPRERLFSALTMLYKPGSVSPFPLCTWRKCGWHSAFMVGVFTAAC